VAETLTRLGISYDHEKKLMNREGSPIDYRLPDLAVSYEGDTFCWEHLGMLSVPSYREQWHRKRVKTVVMVHSTLQLNASDVWVRVDEIQVANDVVWH
jgi:hypothetical protein